MKNWPQLRVMLAVAAILLPICAAAQDEVREIPLGDVARLSRKNQIASVTPLIIDNDNMAQLLNEAEGQRQRHSMLFSFDAVGKNFQVSPSPDVTCSLSFNANTTPLISSRLVQQNLPVSELAKLEGPATLNGDVLEVSVFNGTAWDLREITIGLTVIRRPQAAPDYYEAVKLLPAVATTTPQREEKHSDVTVLYHMKATAAPSGTAIFHQVLDSFVDPGQEWHWAIVGAMGIPPARPPILLGQQ